MKIVYLFIMTYLLLSMTNAFATPPQEINLSYDSDKGILRVEAKHVTHKKKHYIRKMVIYHNAEENPKVLFFTRQSKPSEFLKNFLMQANPGDTIRVKLFCSKGGTKEKSIVIPEIEDADKKQGGEK